MGSSQHTSQPVCEIFLLGDLIRDRCDGFPILEPLPNLANTKEKKLNRVSLIGNISTPVIFGNKVEQT